jgi:hypothetical protein
VIALSGHFPRSLLTLQAHSSLRSLALLGLVVMLLTAWGAWFAGARVAVYAASDSARLHVDREPYPMGTLTIAALFQSSVALGRIRPGQPARVRFGGFPWTQYGSAPARVSNVAGELGDGRIRVGLTLEPGVLSKIPYQHGLTALVDVEIERVSPATLVLRSAGVWTHERAATTRIAP